MDPRPTCDNQTRRRHDRLTMGTGESEHVFPHTRCGMKLPAWAAIAMAIGIGVGNAQAPAARDFRIIRVDPAVDTIVSPGAKLETLGEHFGLTEGPVWVQESNSGYLLFSDLTANVIYKRTPDGMLSAFAENIYNGSDLLNV